MPGENQDLHSRRFSLRQTGSQSCCRTNRLLGEAQEGLAWLFSQHQLCGSEISHRLEVGQLRRVLGALPGGPVVP